MSASDAKAMPQVVLVRPRIPQNVGAIGRVCAAGRAELHVVRPIPFVLNDRSLQRSGMDYLNLLTLKIHDNWPAYEASRPVTSQPWFFTSKGTVSLYEAPIGPADALIFGSESDGLPAAITESVEPTRLLRIPMAEPQARCLNLATAVAVVLFEVLRRHGLQGS